MKTTILLNDSSVFKHTLATLAYLSEALDKYSYKPRAGEA